ncbi:MAG: thiamine-phosphate kinase [Proteobacteria bacterium]|jgi:thiamine-monophosphate kinase|nr:thiamine-phosphate kinase [Pseudomonadota bacterium]
MDEFGLIQQYFKRQNIPNSKVILGVGDDAAILKVSEGQSLVACVDTMVSGVHFHPDVSPSSLGYKLAMVNLSDIAAMGATPVWATLCLTLPGIDEAWLESFSNGLFEALDKCNVQLVGGDTTKGPMTLSLQLGGEVVHDKALARHGATVGDDVWVSGSLGGAAYALDLLAKSTSIDTLQSGSRLRLERPEARVELGLALQGLASACIDVSDGLLADAGHLCASSKVAVDFELSALPLHPSLSELNSPDMALPYALAGGDDYELLFTAGSAQCGKIAELSGPLGIELTKIGSVLNGGVIRCLYNGADVSADHQHLRGFNHFSPH